MRSEHAGCEGPLRGPDDPSPITEVICILIDLERLEQFSGSVPGCLALGRSRSSEESRGGAGCSGEATPVRRALRRGILEDSIWPMRELLNNPGEGALQL